MQAKNSQANNEMVWSLPTREDGSLRQILVQEQVSPDTVKVHARGYFAADDDVRYEVIVNDDGQKEVKFNKDLGAHAKYHWADSFTDDELGVFLNMSSDEIDEVRNAADEANKQKQFVTHRIENPEE